jgi:hypothetical protein
MLRAVRAALFGATCAPAGEPRGDVRAEFPQEGLLNYCHVRVRFGVVEAVNGNIKVLLRRGRRYKNPCYLLLKAQRMAALKTEFVVFLKAA